MTISPLAVRLGAQSPRLSSFPQVAESAGGEVIALAREAGLFLDDWQQLVLERGLGERPDGDWAAFEVAAVVPRQNGKGAIIEALCLASLFLFNEPLSIYSAHEFKTAQETFRRVDELISGTDWLSKQVKRKVISTNELGFELYGGRRLRFLARSKGSGRGFSACRLYFDEAYDLPPESLGAIIPTLSAQPNPQIWYFSSAGQETSDVLRALRARGVAGQKRLAYFEWSAPEGADPNDRAVWALANPALGIRISEQSIEDEQRSLSADPSEFGRERLGWWDDPVDVGGAGIPAEKWVACLDRKSRFGPGPTALGVYITGDRSTAYVAAVGSREDGLAHVEIVAECSPSRAVETVKALVGKRAAPVSIDPGSHAGSLIVPLEDAGIVVEQVTLQKLAAACGSLYDAVTEKHLRHIGQAQLDAAVLSATTRVTSRDAWVWKGSAAAPLMAVTLALHGFGLAAADSIYEERGMAVL